MPHKQRGVYENPRGSGFYWIHYYDAEGQRHRERIGRYELACDTYYERKRAIREGRFRPPERASGLTFKALFEMASAERRHHLAPRTYTENLWTGGRLLQAFGNLAAAKISAERLAEYLGGLRDAGASGSTANRYHALLSAVFKWGVDHKKLDHNPCRDVRRFREADVRVRFLEAGEEAAIREAIRSRCPECEAEFDLALHTGARRTELYSLRWDHVDLERALLTIRGKAHANSRRSRIRHLPINSAAAEALRRLHKRASGSDFVLPRGRLGAEIEKRDRRLWFEECVEAAGVVNFRFHDLRHTFASRLRMAGVELADIMEFLGHTTLQMVMRYAHLAPGRQHANIELLVEEASHEVEKQEGDGRRRGPVALSRGAAGGVARGGEKRPGVGRTAIRTAISGKKPPQNVALNCSQLAEKVKVR
jgi:integrase